MDKCPHCGYSDKAPVATPWNNEMNHYVTKDGKSFGILNNGDDVVKITPSALHPQGLEVIKQSVYEKQKHMEANTPKVQAPTPVVKPVAPRVPVAPVPVPVPVPIAPVVVEQVQSLSEVPPMTIPTQTTA